MVLFRLIFTICVGWIGNVFLIGSVRWLIAKPLALIVVPFLNDDKRKNHSVFGVDDATDLSYYNIAIRNGAHNFTNREVVEFKTWTNTIGDESLEKTEGFQWRYRQSKSRAYNSFRITWGKPRAKKGKKEFYIGWTMSELPKMRLTLQFRPF